MFMIYFILSQNLTMPEMLAFLVAYVFALLIALSFHESAHAYSAYKFGDSTAKSLGRLTLNPVAHIDKIGFLMLLLFGFGWAKPVPVNTRNFKKYKTGVVVTSLAGVCANLILAFIFSGIYFFALNTILSASTTMLTIFLNQFLAFSIMLNISLMIFNLLPIFPLDGFNFLAAITKSGNKLIQFLQRYGFIILIIFIATPLFDILFNIVTTSILNLFFSFWGVFV